MSEVIVGEVEAGRATKVRREINKLIQTSNSSMFDLAYLFYEVKSKNYFNGYGFDKYTGWTKSLNGMKPSKSYYLVRIIENMKAAGLEREEFEPVGLLRLRIISRLKPETTYKDTPVSLLIRELTLKAADMTAEEVEHEVDTIMGLTEDDSMSWLNVKVKTLARDNVIKPAIALAKKHMGSTTKDADGNYKDPGDGAALEMICANFLADPNFNIEETSVDPNITPTEVTDAQADELVDLTDETEE